jgi:beta-phosphoglucomutase
MEAIKAVKKATERKLTAAGGITTREEIDTLDKLGIDAVVGMAIYTGVMPLVGGPESRSPGVIFDFDGVIADSEAQHLRAFQQTFAERGWSLSQEDYYGRYLGYSDREVFEIVAREKGEALPREELDRLIESKGRAYAHLVSAGPELCAGADDAIRRLAEHFPLAIASSAFAHEIVDVLEATGLLTFFKVIVGAEDVAEGKPSPAPYLEAARRLGIAPEACVAIEDSPWGLESARRAGLKTIGITHTYPAGRLAEADVVVQKLDEITDAFIQSLLSST